MMVDSVAALVPLSDLNPCFVARFAKERRLRIWRDYVAPTANLDQKDKQFVAKVSHLSIWRCTVHAVRLVIIQRSE